MEVNGLPLKTRPVERSGSLVLYIDAPIAECAALDGKTLEVTHYGKTLGVYPDHGVTGIAARDGYCEVTARRALAPDTAATLERLERRTAALADAQSGQESTNEQTAERIDVVEEAVLDLAAAMEGAAYEEGADHAQADR